MKEQNILIVGCGYFGTRLLQQLAATQAHHITATTTTPARRDELLVAGADRVLVWAGDDSIAAAVRDADAVICALKSPTHDQEATARSLGRIAEALTPAQHLVYISSLEVYPGALAEAREEDGCPDRAAYAQEALFAAHDPACVLRIAQLFGRGSDHRGMARDMRGHLEKIYARTRGALPGDGNLPVHLTHVRDLAACAHLAVAERVEGIYNFCHTLACDRKAFYRMLCRHYDLEQIRWSPEMPTIEHMRLPATVHTERLRGLPFALDGCNYQMPALVAP